MTSLMRSKEYVLMVHFAVIRFDGASGARRVGPFQGSVAAPDVLKSRDVRMPFFCAFFWPFSRKIASRGVGPRSRGRT